MMNTPLMRGLLACVLCTAPLTAQEAVSIYGPGGPHTALIKAAELFKNKTGITVNVVFGPQANWEKDALQKADMLFSASDNQMTAFLQTHKNFSQEDVFPLYLHDSIILVKKGNPRKIKGIASLLAMDDVRIVVNDGAGISQTSGTGVWEDILGRTQNIENFINFRKKIVAYVPNSGMGKAAFTNPELRADAWITWEDWALSNDFGEAVSIEKNLNISRPLNIALKKNAKKEARQFLEFLSTPEAQIAFKQFGWHRK